MPFQGKRGGGDGDVFGRIMEEVEELTLREAGGEARRFYTLCGYIQVPEGESVKKERKERGNKRRQILAGSGENS